MENNFAGISVCSLGKIEKYFSHKLTNYFIQGVRNNYPFIFILILYSSFVIVHGFQDIFIMLTISQTKNIY